MGRRQAAGSVRCRYVARPARRCAERDVIVRTRSTALLNRFRRGGIRARHADGEPVRWVIAAHALTASSNTLMAPQLRIDLPLRAGGQTIAFIHALASQRDSLDLRDGMLHSQFVIHPQATQP